MSQLTIYLDGVTLKELRQRAKQEHRSISEWVKQAVQDKIRSVWPDSFIESLGSLSDTPLQRPEQPAASLDRQREML